jgi:hypothetical protein
MIHLKQCHEPWAFLTKACAMGVLFDPGDGTHARNRMGWVNGFAGRADRRG